MTQFGIDPFHMPPGACDTHCHVVGPRAQFPFSASRLGDPTPDATEGMLAAMHRQIGAERCVVVQSALHGADPAVTLHALSRGRGTRRGIVLLDPQTPDEDLVRLHDVGVRGIRHNLVGHGSDDARRPEHLMRLASRLAPLGWHFLLHMSAEQVLGMDELLRNLPIPCVIDHLGRVDPGLGVEQPAVRTLLGLLERGRTWVKIACVDKLSRLPYPHQDVSRLAAALVRAAPERVIWGTDWPHPDARGLRKGTVPDDRALANLIPSYAPDADVRHKLLVENPALLYGFE